MPLKLNESNIFPDYKTATTHFPIKQKIKTIVAPAVIFILPILKIAKNALFLTLLVKIFNKNLALI